MPETTTTTVQEDSEGYYRTRIPKALGDAMGIGGRKVEWEVTSGKKLTLEIVDDD